MRPNASLGLSMCGFIGRAAALPWGRQQCPRQTNFVCTVRTRIVPFSCALACLSRGHSLLLGWDTSMLGAMHMHTTGSTTHERSAESVSISLALQATAAHKQSSLQHVAPLSSLALQHLNGVAVAVVAAALLHGAARGAHGAPRAAILLTLHGILRLAVIRDAQQPQ